MTTYNFREQIGMPKLAAVLGVGSLKALNIKQKKAVRNIKYCANDQWMYVNSWYDEKDAEARAFMLNARQLFDTIYDESLTNVYDEGACCFNNAAKSWLKDIRFCGKKFLQTVALYFTAKLLEEAVPEVNGKEEDAQRVLDDLRALKAEIM